MEQKIITKSATETQQLSRKVLDSLRTNVIALHGDLGSGKTTFVQGLARALGITNRIISPTFIIMRTYQLNLKGQNSKVKGTAQKFRSFYHVDLYRIQDERDIEGLGLLELLHAPESLVVIEWPEKIEKFLPENALHIFFEYLDENKRKIEITS